MNVKLIRVVTGEEIVAEVQEDVSKKYNEMFGSKLITPDKKNLLFEK